VYRVSFSINIFYIKVVEDPITGYFGPAITWFSGGTGVHAGDGGFIVQSVSEYVDGFLLAYLRVNEDDCN